MTSTSSIVPEPMPISGIAPDARRNREALLLKSKFDGIARPQIIDVKAANLTKMARTGASS